MITATFLTLLIAPSQAHAISRWTLFCERNLIGYDFTDQIDYLRDHSVSHEEYVQKLISEYRAVALKIHAGAGERADVHKLRQFGTRLRAIGAAPEIIEVYQRFERDAQN